MKKFFTFSTGIVILIAILSAWGCKSPKDDMGVNKAVIYNKTLVYSKVVIYLRSIDSNGEKFIYMYDSNGNTSIDNMQPVDSFETYVQPESDVFWELERNSGIKKIKEIKSSHGNGNIFKDDPSQIPFSKAFRLKLKKDIYGREKYDIKIRLEDNTEITIDPFLRIPPVDTIP